MFYLISFYLFMMSMMNWFFFISMNLFNYKIIIEWNMLIFNSIKINYLIYLDWINFIFSSTIFLISSMIIIYSMNYMKNDIFIKRFMILINIFIFSMIFMIISPNMISIILGWDGLGMSSYCLVAYYQNKKSFNSSMITILMNRIGDIFILMNISMIMMNGMWNIMNIFNKNNIISWLMIMIAITKSAQIPFSSWLPLAMAAPTPVSSLVHSSTLVTAGIYLLIRFNYIMNNNSLKFLLMLSCMTMFMAGSSALFEFDIKKIIALSTLSQLGLMMMSISFKQTNLAFFHLITHAMFKSLLFLCSGIIIHNFFNHQDIRFISFMNLNMPFINLTFNIASFTLCGMPFLTGFYSKDLIIENLIMNNKFNNIMIFIMMFMSMSLTMIYSFRLMMFISLKNLKINMFNFYKSFNLMNYSIIILLILSIFYGSILNWIIFSSLNKIFLPKKLKLMIFLFMFLGFMFSIIFKYNFKNKNLNKMNYFYNNMWFLNLWMKKNKNNILLLNNKMIIMNELFWMEYLSSKNLLNLLKILMKKMILNIKFINMIYILIMYLILILYFF